MAKKLRILVTNDDGVASPGLWKLAQAFAEVGEVLVAAPAQERTGTGTAITLGRPLAVQAVMSPVEGVQAFSVDGTPCDAVVTALRRLARHRIEVVASGINAGANIGSGILTSGTVGAAMHAHLLGLTAIAFSLEYRSKETMHWDTALAVARQFARGLADGSIPRDAFLNVNVPAVPLTAIQGLRVTTVAPVNPYRVVEVEEGEEGQVRYALRRRDDIEFAEDTDVWAVHRDYISVTPLQGDIVARHQLAQVEAWLANLRNGLSGAEGL